MKEKQNETKEKQSESKEKKTDISMKLNEKNAKKQDISDNEYVEDFDDGETMKKPLKKNSHSMKNERYSDDKIEKNEINEAEIKKNEENEKNQEQNNQSKY